MHSYVQLQVFVGLTSGSVQVYRRGADGAWLLKEPVVIQLGPHPINALLPISTHVYASCGDKVHVIDCFTADVTVRICVKFNFFLYF